MLLKKKKIQGLGKITVFINQKQLLVVVMVFCLKKKKSDLTIPFQVWVHDKREKQIQY